MQGYGIVKNRLYLFSSPMISTDMTSQGILRRCYLLTVWAGKDFRSSMLGLPVHLHHLHGWPGEAALQAGEHTQGIRLNIWRVIWYKRSGEVSYKKGLIAMLRGMTLLLNSWSQFFCDVQTQMNLHMLEMDN